MDGFVRVEYFQYLMDVVLGFLSQPQIPELIQGFGAALLTILVAVAIFLIQSDIAFDFDRQVIVEEVVKFRQSLISVLLIFIPLFLWREETGYLEIILFLMSLSGLFVMIYVLRRSYKWINVFESKDMRDVTGYRMKARLKYLGSLKEAEKKVVMWSSVWKKQYKSSTEERMYVRAFAKWVEALVGSKKEHSLCTANRGIRRVRELSENISFFDSVVFGDLFRSLLRINEQIAPTEPYRNITQGSTETHSLRNEMGRMIQFFTKQSFQEKGTLVSSTFFDVLEKHLQKQNSKEYSEKIIGNIADPFFENVADSAEHRNIWGHYFPNEWRVTKKSLQDKDNFLSDVWLDCFLRWFSDRVLTLNYMDGIDKPLDEVSKNLFPTVCPITWAMILTFRGRAFFQVKLLIGYPKLFGDSPRYNSVSLQEFQTGQGERDNTIELALFIFRSHFTEEKISGYMRELEGLEYKKDIQQSYTKDEVKSIFEDMLKLLDQQKTEGENKT